MTQSPGARPTGVTILAVFSIGSGILGVLGGIAALGLGAFLALSSPVAGVGLGAVALFAFVVSAASIVIGLGFWLLKSWAWPVGVILEAFSVLSSILSIASDSSVGSAIVSLVVAAAIIWYLHQPHVRAAFGARATGFPIVGDRFDRYIPGSKA